MDIDTQALHAARYIMQLKKIAELEKWPEYRLLAAIQCEVIEAIKRNAAA